jgi:hypothetical protein
VIFLAYILWRYETWEKPLQLLIFLLVLLLTPQHSLPLLVGFALACKFFDNFSKECSLLPFRRRRYSSFASHI